MSTPETKQDDQVLDELKIGGPLAERAPETGALVDGGSFRDSAKMVVTVTLVAAISAGLLGYVYSMTKPRIEESRLAEKVTAFSYILPSYDNQPITTECALPLLDADTGQPANPPRTAQLFTAAKGSETIGYAVQLFTTDGFGPRIDVIVGAKPDGTVTGVYVLNHQETPGLGAKVTDSQTEWGPDRKLAGKPYLHQFQNRAPAQGLAAFQVKKDGGQIDAITASTITSRAVAGAIADGAWTVRALGESGLPAGCGVQAVPAAPPAAAAPAAAAPSATEEGGAK